MNKLEYVTRQLARTKRKRYECYVITRIWHLLNDLTIKFVTQQYVIRKDGRALTDMYFPQLKVHVEIDEAYHLSQVEQDKLREADIINATGHDIIRVDMTEDLETINKRIDKIVAVLKSKKEVDRNFKKWDIQADFDPQTYINRGYISLEDDVAFSRMVDAANCFGNNYKGLQKGGAKHPFELNKIIWFPKLYSNEDWSNSISDDEEIIKEKSNIPDKVKGHVEEHINSPIKNRIVFARVKSPLGDVMYRFRGEYELCVEKSNYENGLIWKRVATKVKTYKAK